MGPGFVQAIEVEQAFSEALFEGDEGFGGAGHGGGIPEIGPVRYPMRYPHPTNHQKMAEMSHFRPVDCLIQAQFSRAAVTLVTLVYIYGVRARERLYREKRHKRHTSCPEPEKITAVSRFFFFEAVAFERG